MIRRSIKLESPKTQPKTLVIGSSGHSHVTCVAWIDLKSVNLKDFDIVVVNVSSLDEDTIRRLPSYGFWDEIRTQLSLLLGSGGRIIALTPELRRIKKKDEWLSNWDWSPLDFGICPEAGDTILIQTTKFERYLSRLKKWTFYFFVPNGPVTRELADAFGSPYQNQYTLPAEPFAVNRYGKILAGEFPLLVASDNSNNVFGSLAVLPFIPELEQKEALNLILEDLLGESQQALPPEWVSQIPMPFVDTINGEISKKQAAIAVLQKEIASSEQERAEIEKWKRLVYATGRELEQIVEEAFIKLGATTMPPAAEEEFIFEYKTTVGVIECKGVGKSISLDHVRQTDSHVLKFTEAMKREGKGVLFGNAWRNLPMSERGTPDAPICPDNVVKHARQREVALVNSCDFLEAFCRFLSGDVSGDAILDALTTQSGIVEFPKGG